MRNSKISAQQAGYLGGFLLSLIIGYWIGSAVEDRSQMAEYYYRKGRMDERAAIEEQEIHLRIKALTSEKMNLQQSLGRLQANRN